MAKSKSFFGLRRGSTKSLTFQVLNGRQVTKDRVYDVKNPRTFSQMQQRMVMATAAAAYAGMREIVDHSFEGYTYGQPTMSEFIRLNAKMLRDGLLAGDSNLAFNPYKDRTLYPNPYIVSNGSLKSPSFTVVMSGNSLVYLSVPMNLPGDNVTLRDWLNYLGISVKGYITFLAVVYSSETKDFQWGWVRLTPIQSELDELVEDKNPRDIFEIESNVPIDEDNGQSTNILYCTLDFDKGGINWGYAAVILSDKSLSWKRSKAIMKFDIKEGGENPSPAAAALATYPVGTDYILNGGTV